MTGDDHADLDVTSQGLVVERDDPAGQIVHRRDPMKRVVVEAMAPEGVLPQTLVAGRPELVVRDAIEAQDAEGLVAMPPLEVRIRRGVPPTREVRVYPDVHDPQRVFLKARNRRCGSRLESRHWLQPSLDDPHDHSCRVDGLRA